MKEFLKKELYSFRAVAAILARWLLLAVPTGLVCGAVGTAFHLAVEHVTEWRAEHIWLLWLLPVAGLAIVALYKVTGCEGVGTNNVIRAVHSGESVSPLLVPAIFFGTVLTHLCGGSAGREGAALQMGGSIGYNIAKLFRFSDHDRRTATACGMAAFFSALFGTPLSATLFGIMVEDVGLAFSVAFVPGFAAALIAYGVSLACGISPTHFELTAPALSIDSTLLVAVLGVACALVARAFCWLLHTMEHEMPRRLPNPWVRAVVGGVAVVALSYLMGVGRYNGAGMGVITAAVEQGQALPWDFICKILLIVDILITTMSVIGRYVPFIPDPAWSEEVVLTCMSYMAVLSAALAIRRGAHIRMTAFDVYLPKVAVKVLDIIADLAVCILGLIMLVVGWNYATTLGGRGFYVSMPWLSRFWMYFPVPLAGVAMIIFEIEALYNHVKSFFVKEEN